MQHPADEPELRCLLVLPAPNLARMRPCLLDVPPPHGVRFAVWEPPADGASPLPPCEMVLHKASK